MGSPADIPGLLARWRASDLVLADGAAVGSWPDSSGNGHTATQTTASAKPTYHAADPDGLGSAPCVEFAGGDYLNIAFASELVTAPLTVGVVVRSKQAPVGTYDGIYWWGSGSTRYGVMDNPSTGPLFYTGAGAATMGSALTADAYHVLTGTEAATAQTTYKDGTAGATSATAYSPPTSGSGTIGKWSFGGGWHGELLEIVHFDHVLTAGERATWHSYVEDTYGVTVADYVASGGESYHHGGALTGVASGSVTGHAQRRGSGVLTAAASGAVTGSFVATAALSGADVVLTWPAQSGSGYQVEKDGTVVATVAGTTWTDTSPTAGSHTYRVGVVQ